MNLQSLTLGFKVSWKFWGTKISAMEDENGKDIQEERQVNQRTTIKLTGWIELDYITNVFPASEIEAQHRSNELPTAVSKKNVSTCTTQHWPHEHQPLLTTPCSATSDQFHCPGIEFRMSFTWRTKFDDACIREEQLVRLARVRKAACWSRSLSSSLYVATLFTATLNNRRKNIA